MEKIKHTPTPWGKEAKEQFYKQSLKIGYSPEMSKANADHIVKCVNCHDELVEAINNIEKLSIGFDTSKLTTHQKNTIALIFQNTVNAKNAFQKASA